MRIFILGHQWYNKACVLYFTQPMVAHEILVSARVLLVLTLGLWTSDLDDCSNIHTLPENQIWPAWFSANPDDFIFTMSGDWRLVFPIAIFCWVGWDCSSIYISSNQFFVLSQSPGHSNGFVERKVFWLYHLMGSWDVLGGVKFWLTSRGSDRND